MNSTTSINMGVSRGESGLRNLNSPIPYLFGGLALMLAVIAVSLLTLACSYRKHYSSSSSSNSGCDEEKPPMMVDNISESKIVVIMAGESKPTFLAMPVPSTIHTQQIVSN
ncbi:hypothetical protein VNO77_21469 [Canavalia gladiata]|uniref:Uncharacterized protein n=1 Tax=Canavalia gladiata TaxID=3824 RepID=A0AAN9QMB6_CANGL